MLAASGISKRYPGVVALDGVDLAANRGEIHVLLGENGAGKTTLVNVLSGRTRPDAGSVVIDGTPLSLGSPEAALKAGIAAVYQSPMLFERMTWEENLVLAGFGAGSAIVSLAQASARAGAIAGRLGFALPPPRARPGDRSIAERVRLEVLRALSFDPQVLILDEPTSVLAPGQLGTFLELLRNLRADGRAIILITHKLREAMAVADRITVLRRGRVAARLSRDQASEAELARHIVGDLPQALRREGGERADVALRLEGLTLRHDGRLVLDRVNLEVRAGEITGLAGVEGNGQIELVEILAGVRAPDDGAVRLAGGETRHDGSEGGRQLSRKAEGPRAGLAVIPQDRDHDGLILNFTLWENLLLAPDLRAKLTPRLWLNRRRAVSYCRELLTRFRVRAPGPHVSASALSGGNRQRLEVARALASSPRVVVAHDVSRGLDLAAAAELHRSLSEFAAGGGAVLLISSDLDELLALSDRLAVLSAGRIREVADDERNPERIGLLMTGR